MSSKFPFGFTYLKVDDDWINKEISQVLVGDTITEHRSIEYSCTFEEMEMFGLGIQLKHYHKYEY